MAPPPIFTAKPPSPSPLSSPSGGARREIAFHAIITLLLGREGGVMEETSEEYFFSGKLHSEGIKLFLEQELLCCCPVSLFESSGHYDYECHDWWFSILSFANLCKSNHAKVCSPSQVSIDKRACKCKAMVPFKQPDFALGVKS